MQWICRRFILFTFNLPCLPGPPGRIGSHIQKKTHPQVCLCLISGFLSILTVDFPSLLRSSVNLTFGRRWCVGPILRLILITFCLPYLLPHCGFSFTALQLGKSYVRKKAMQWICRRLILITFNLPYLLPYCGFPFTASQFGKSYVRKKVMQWICRRVAPPSSTALLLLPCLPGPLGG